MHRKVRSERIKLRGNSKIQFAADIRLYTRDQVYKSNVQVVDPAMKTTPFAIILLARVLFKQQFEAKRLERYLVVSISNEFMSHVRISIMKLTPSPTKCLLIAST